jgi:hypothetical protein
MKCNKIREIFEGNVMHNHDADIKARLNQQILNNSVKRKEMGDFSERSSKLIHKELQNQYVENLTYKDISRNIHKTRSSQLLPLPTDIEVTH